MKKIKFFLVLALILSAFSAADAYALQCKSGQSLNGDECWTEVQVSLLETNVVSAGAILVYDMNTGDVDRGAYEVVLATASNDEYRIAGVAQTTIATGDRGLVLVKGKGQLLTRSACASGDRLYVSSSEGKSGTTPGLGNTVIVSPDAVGWALEACTSDATADAYITVI